MKQNNAFTFCIQLIFLTTFIVPIFAQTDTLKQPMNRLGVPEVITGKAMIEEKVIGASRSVRKLEDLPITVYIISQEDILKNGYTTLTDVLKMVPGIRVSQPGNGVNGETFLMRGLEGNTYTKILLNNLPIQPTVSSTLSIGEQLPIAQVERIEVIYGSASAVYGADAMAGVINIITKGTQNSTFANVNAVVGDYGYRHVNFMAGGKIGRDKNIVQYSFFGNQGSRQKLNITEGEYQKVFSPIRSFFPILFDKSDEEVVQFVKQIPNNGLNQIIPNFPFYQGTLLKATLSDMPQESYLLAGNIKYRNFQLSYYDMYRSSHSSLGRQPLFFGYHDEGNRIMEKTQIIALNYTKSWEKLTATANVMYLRHRYNPQSSMATNYTNLGKSYVFQASDDLFAEAVLNYNLTKKWELTGGVSYKVASTLPTTNDLRQPFDTDEYRPFTNYQPKPDSILGSFGYNPTIVNNFGAFAQAYFSSQRWNIVLGWRFDSPSNYDARSYQRIAVLYKTSPKTSIRVSGGYAFKAPSLTTAYQSVAIQDLRFDSLLQRPVATGRILYQVLPNPNLDPEESGGVDIGFRYALNANTYIDVVGFATSVSNLIIAAVDTVRENDPRFPKAALNVNARTYKNNANTQSFLTGLQVVARAKNIVPAIQLQTNFSYTLQVGFEVFDEKLQEINQYRQVPVHTLQWSIGMNLTKKWYINFENVAMTSWYRRYIPNVDTNLEQQFIKGYYTLDFLSRYQFNKNLGAYLKIVNVFDTKYGGLSATGLDVDLYYMPQLGRNIQFGVSFQLE